MGVIAYNYGAETHGGVRVNWSKNAAEFRLELDLPEDCSGRVSLPPVAGHVHGAAGGTCRHSSTG